MSEDREQIQQNNPVVETPTNDISGSQIVKIESSEGKNTPVSDQVKEQSSTTNQATDKVSDEIAEKPEDVKTQVETPKVYPKLSERDLKEKINLLRQKIEHDERDIRTIFRDISLHNQGGNDLKAKRDGLNARVKELSPKAAALRKQRDEINAKIAELKAQRDQMRGIGKEFNEKIGELKKTRDDLNLTARGRAETLEKAYSDELTLFLTADIPLAVSYTHLRAHETRHDLVCRLLLEKKK